MEKLYQHINNTCEGVISYEDAVQLMLWIYCTLDVLPKEFRDVPLSRQDLAGLFSKLSAAGKVAVEPTAIADGVHVSVGDTTQPEHWDNLITKLLRKEMNLDDAFRRRLNLYV